MLFSNFIQADAISSSSDDPIIIFEKISVSENPSPYEPFTISVSVSTPARHSDLFLYLNVPSEISILTPIVAELDATKSSIRTGSWTLLASEPGSYSIDIIATSNNPPETTTFDFNLSVGTVNSLIVTDVIIPGNILEKETFTIGTTLKNSAIVDDKNLLIWLTVPDHLQIKGPVSIKIDVIESQEEVTFFWDVNGFKPGSYEIIFNFRSQNAGSNSLEANVNIGSYAAPDLKVVAMNISGIDSNEANVSPSETKIPISFRLKNTGNSYLYDISAELLMLSPFKAESESQISRLGQLAVELTREVDFQVDIDELASLGLHEVVLNLYYSDGENNYSSSSTFDIRVTDNPIKISSVTVVNPPLYAGDAASELNIELLNTGVNVYDVRSELVLPPGFSPSWGGSDTEFFGKISSSEKIIGHYFIDLDRNLEPNEYKAAILLSKDGESFSKLDFDFTVNPKAVFKTLDVDYSQLFRGAVNVPFRITLQNTGSEIAENVQTKLLGGNTIPGVKSSLITTLGDEESIGNVLPGASFTTTYFVSLDPEVDTGLQNTSIEISWEGDNDNSFSQNLNVNYNVPSGPSLLLYYAGIPFAYVIIMAIIIAGVILFIVERRKKMVFLKRFDDSQFLRDESDSPHSRNALNME